ncbi:uncharacterized protein LOC119174558 isoform X3 [Rhipicephalus microplus]
MAAKLDVASSATSTPPSEPPVLPLAQSGDGTGPAVTLGMTEEPPKIKKSLAALTEICRAISDEEKREYAGEVEPKTAEEVAEEFQQTHHHPFKLKEPPPPIRFNIPNATNLPVKTLAEKVADAAHLHKQFPVSSGNQHRVKELEWVPVEKTEPAPAPKAARAAKSSAAPSTEGGTSPLALMPPPLPKTETFSPLPNVATPPVFQVEDVPLPVSSAVISSTVTEPPDPAPALEVGTAKIDKGAALLKAEDKLPEPDGQASGGSKDKDQALDLHTEDESPPLGEPIAPLGEPDGLLDDSKQAKTEEVKRENVDESQHDAQCDTFSDDANPTFLIEEVPLESIPLPEGPYVPPETQQSQLPGETSASVQDTNPQSQKVRKASKWDNASEQTLSKIAVLDDIKESIPESSTMAIAKPQIDIELKPEKRDSRKPTAKIKNQEVTPSKQQPSTEAKKLPKSEPSSKGVFPACRKSELDIQQKTTRIGESKNKERTPITRKVEQHPLPEVLREVDKVVESKQASEQTDMRSKLQKLRRESIMSMIKFEPLEITPKTATIQSFEMKQDGASLCKQAWSRIPASQKESAYFSSENKKASPETPRPVQNKKEDSDRKTGLSRSQSLPKAKNPSPQMEKRLNSIDSADTVQQPRTAGQGGTMTGKPKSDSFLHRQIQENVAPQSVLGCQTFGNIIVNPAPPVQPPERCQADSSATMASSSHNQSHKTAVGEAKQESKALPTSFAAEVLSPIPKQPKENSVTPKEPNRHSDTIRSRSNVHSASAMENRLVSDHELSTKLEAKDGDKKTSKGERDELMVKSQEYKQGGLKEHTDASRRVSSSVKKSADVEKLAKDKKTALQPSSKSVSHKQTRDSTPSQPKESAQQTLDGTPTQSKESAKQTLDDTPSRFKESSKQTPDGNPTWFKESAKQTSDGTPSRSKESTKQTLKGTPSQSKKFAKQVPDDIPSRSKESSKETRGRTPSRSKECAKQTPEGTPSQSKESAKQAPDDTPSRSKECAKQTPEGTPSQSKESAKQATDDTPSRSKESSKNIPDGTPSRSKECAKQTLEGTPSQSKKFAKQVPDDTPSRSKESSKETPGGTPTRSKESVKQTSEGAPSRSEESFKQTPDGTPSRSKECAKQTPEGTPSQSKESAKQAPDDTPSRSKESSENIPDDTPSRSKECAKQTPEGTPSQSKESAKQATDDTPSRSKESSKNIPDGTPSRSKECAKQTPEGTPSRSKKFAKQAPDGTPSRSKESFKETPGGTPTRFKESAKQTMGGTPSQFKELSKQALDDIPSGSKESAKQTPDDTPSRFKESSKQTSYGNPTWSKESAKQTPDGTPSRSKESAKQTLKGTPSRSKKFAKQAPDDTPSRSKESFKETPGGTPTRSKESAKQTSEGTPPRSKESSKQASDDTPSRSKESSKNIPDGTPSRSKECAKQTPEGTPSQSKESTKQTPEGAPSQSKESTKQALDDTSTRFKESSKETPGGNPTRSKESAKQTPDGTPSRSKECAKQTSHGTSAQAKESAKHIQMQALVERSAPNTDSHIGLSPKNETPSHTTAFSSTNEVPSHQTKWQNMSPQQQGQIQKAESLPKPNEKIATTQVSELRDSKCESTFTQSKESTKHIQKEIVVPNIGPKIEYHHPPSTTKKETPFRSSKSQEISPQPHEPLLEAELSLKPNENIITSQMSQSRDSKCASSSTQSRESAEYISKHLSDAKTALKRESCPVSSTKKETPFHLIKSENPLPQQQERISKAESSQKSCENVAATQVSKLQDKTLLPSLKSMPHKQTRDITPSKSKEPAKHTPKHVLLMKIAAERHSHTAFSSKNEVPCHQTKLQNLLPQQKEEKCKARSSPKTDQEIVATQISESQDIGNACQHTQGAVVKAQQGQTAVKRKEQTGTPLKRNTAPGKAVTQESAASTPISPSDIYKTGESEQASVEQRMHRRTYVINNPSNVPVSLAQSALSSADELDGAAQKPTTPVRALAAPPSLDNPPAEQKVQELIQEVSTKERCTEPEAAAKLLSAQSVPAERHSRHNAGDRHEQEHSCDHRYHQLAFEPVPPHKTQMPENTVFTSGSANKSESEGILPQQGNSVTVNTKYISPSLKRTNVVPLTLLPSPGGCTAEVKAPLPESDNKDATIQQQQNSPSAETSRKPVVQELENPNDLADNKGAKSTKYGSSLEQSQIGSDKHDLPRKKQLHMSQERVGKASKSTLLSAAVSCEEGEELADDVRVPSLLCLPTESIETNPMLHKMAPGPLEILTSQYEQEPTIPKYDDMTSSQSCQSEGVLPCLLEEKSSVQESEVKSDNIKEASDLADKVPKFGVTGDQPQTQAVVVSSENLIKTPTTKVGEDDGTLSFHQMQAIESDGNDKAEKHAVHTRSGTASTKEIGAEDHSDTAVQPMEGVQTKSMPLLSMNENVIVEQIISVSGHAPGHSTEDPCESASPVHKTNKFEKKASNSEQDFNVKLSSENVKAESSILSKEYTSTKRVENEGPLEKEPQDDAFELEMVKKETNTSNYDHEDRPTTLKHSDDQRARCTDEQPGAIQGDVVDTTVFEQSDDIGKHALEVKSDTLQEGVTDLACDLTTTPKLESGGPTAPLLLNQATMTLSQTGLRSHLTEEQRSESCSEAVSRNEMDALQDAIVGAYDRAIPASKGPEPERATKQKGASHKQEVSENPPIEAVAKKSTNEPLYADRIGSLDEHTSCAGENDSTVSILSRIEAGPMSLMWRKEKTSTEMASMKDREEAVSADAPTLEDGVGQPQQSSAVTEHNIIAALPTKTESENTQVLVMVQQRDLNDPQERNAPISQEMCVLEVDIPSVRASASNLTDESGPVSLETNKFEMPLVNVADEVAKANCGNEEIKANSGDDVKQPLHKEHKVFTEYEAQPTPPSMAKSSSNQVEQAHNLSSTDQSVKHIPKHAAVVAVAPVPDENEILVLTLAEESQSRELKHDETDYCQQQDQSDKNIAKATQHSTPSHQIQTKDEVATVGVARPPKRENDESLQHNTVIQPEQSIICSNFNANAESTQLASSLEEHCGTSAAEAAVLISTQEEHSVVRLDDIEVATVIEVSAEEFVLSAGLPPTPILGSDLTETSQLVYATNTNEQCSLFVSTTEGGVESIDSAVAHPALLSSDQGSVEFFTIGSCKEEHTVVPLAGHHVQDYASAAESADEALDMLSDGAVLSTEAVLNELSCEKKPEATLAIIDSSSHQTHTPETELDSTSRPNMPLKTRLESQMPPLTTPPQTQLVDSLVVLDERRQSDLKPLSFTASYAEAIQKSSEQPTEDLPLQLRDADEMLIGESSLTSQVVVSPPPTLVGNQEASLNVTNTEEPIRATCLLSPAVTESPVQVETEKQFVKMMMTQAEPATEVMLACHGEWKQREPTHNPMPLRKRLAMRQLRESVSEESTLFPEQHSPSFSTPCVEERTSEEQEPKKAVVKPKRRGRTSQARSRGEGDEAEMVQVRRSTRNKKAPERFCF